MKNTAPRSFYYRRLWWYKPRTTQEVQEVEKQEQRNISLMGKIARVLKRGFITDWSFPRKKTPNK